MAIPATSAQHQLCETEEEAERALLPGGVNDSTVYNISQASMLPVAAQDMGSRRIIQTIESSSDVQDEPVDPPRDDPPDTASLLHSVASSLSVGLNLQVRPSLQAQSTPNTHASPHRASHGPFAPPVAAKSLMEIPLSPKHGEDRRLSLPVQSQSAASHLALAGSIVGDSSTDVPAIPRLKTTRFASETEFMMHELPSDHSDVEADCAESSKNESAHALRHSISISDLSVNHGKSGLYGHKISRLAILVFNLDGHVERLAMRRVDLFTYVRHHLFVF
jgi:hypothetical protein